ncbi:MAG: hypothetical protein HY301_01405 [Verrucomicrobia bacterium]|nr:hypothetical protein [Verrucomicrobiota bacterium]
MFTCAIAWLAGAQLHAEAIIEGAVTLPPPKGTAPTVRYQAAGEVAPPPVPVAVVYLEGDFPKPAAPRVLRMAQRQFQFEHAVLPVGVGTRVEFPNQDAEYHNVFSYSKTKRFDLGRYRMDETPAALTFEQPGVVRLYCDIHDHMRGAILVLATPHFTSTAPGGKFRLAGLPAGTFTLKAWIDEKTVREQRVTLTDGETLRINFPAPSGESQ